MLAHKIKILSWNCRGLGILDKCNVVRETIRSSRCDICMLQETKLNEFSLSYVARFLPSYFDSTCAYNLAINWGILIAWKRKFKCITSWSTMHTTSVVLENMRSGEIACYTVVYGPSNDLEKTQFL